MTTYKTLLKFLNTLSEDQLLDNVTIYDAETDEWKPVFDFNTTKIDDVLHKDHVYLVI